MSKKPPSPTNASNAQVTVTKLIDGILWCFPESRPIEVARILAKRLYPSNSREMFPAVYEKYQNMIRVRKSNLKRWRTDKVYGRPLKALVESHRREWCFERPLAVGFILRVKGVASRCTPGVVDEKPVGVWYVVPNRNRQLEYHDELVSVRVMPQSGTVRILLGKEFAAGFSYEDLEKCVSGAFMLGGLTYKESAELVQGLQVSSRHRVFHIGAVTPFKIPFYKESLGLTISADGSHPDHLETTEEYPSWVRPLLTAIAKQTQVVSALTDQIHRHLGILADINRSFRAFTKALNANAKRKRR
jgi:hypothetical protein